MAGAQAGVQQKTSIKGASWGASNPANQQNLNSLKQTLLHTCGAATALLVM